ncbi:hypothetical protein ABZ208_01370 [Streptomyces sp. NPDC006208]|uniref:hypothetical protein n=1 Tax=Streptomyces sp. NPDC006208 TaxID=3156734 RepID=UPI0033B2CDAE
MKPAVTQAAGEALARHAWGDVFAILSEADRHQPLDPEDLERLALAAHLIGKDSESDELWTRAHHAWLTRGDVPRAVRCVFWLGLDLVLSGEWARGAGWTARAQRLLDAGQPDCVEQGYLLALEALQNHLAGDAATAEAVAEQTLTFATRFGDPDLMNFAMVSIGESLVRLGRVEEGVQLLDEAMVAVTAGEVSPVVSGLAYCAVISACREAFDLRRAREWTAELSRWCAAQEEPVPCLVHRVESRPTGRTRKPATWPPWRRFRLSPNGPRRPREWDVSSAWRSPTSSAGRTAPAGHWSVMPDTSRTSSPPRASRTPSATQNCVRRRFTRPLPAGGRSTRR